MAEVYDEDEFKPCVYSYDEYDYVPNTIAATPNTIILMTAMTVTLMMARKHPSKRTMNKRLFQRPR